MLMPALRQAAVYQISFSPMPEDEQIKFENEGVLSERRFGTFWQSLLEALEEEGAIPWDTDTDQFFYDFTCFSCWRTGGPCADPAFLDRKYALLRAFHDRWEALHPEEQEGEEYQ